MALFPGWGFPINSRKAHYFVDGEMISLCRRMMFSGPRQDDNHHSPDNCAECMRRRDRLADQIDAGTKAG